MPDTCFFLFNCKTNCVDSKKKAFRVHFSFKSRSNIFKEMISWIANIKELVVFETLDAFKRIGRPRSFFFITAMISFKRRVLYKEIGNAQIFKAKIHGTFLL